jgi:sialic acid synthase SpsE
MLLEIGGRPIGPDHGAFVIAEIGLNHGGRLASALELVDAAAWAGASAIKLQTLHAADLVAPHCPAPTHVDAASMREFFRTFELSFSDHRAVVSRARRHNLAVLSTPFSERAVMMLEPLELDAYKIASGDLTYDGLIDKIARTRRPMIMSTGMSELHEVQRAVLIAREAGAAGIGLLHCVSAYPTPVDAQNLRAIVTLARTTGLPIGLSDHGPGLVSALVAATLGACIYERHLVLDDDPDAIDRAVSSTPDQLRAIVQALAEAHASFGDGIKRCLAAERANVQPSRRGLYAARRLQAGEVITTDDIAVLRPASELDPSHVRMIVGTRLSRPVAAGEPFVRADLAMVRTA